MISLKIPIRLISEANDSSHWTKKRKRKLVHAFLLNAYFNTLHKEISLPCVVNLIRVAPRQFDEDNLYMSFKHIRDWIADRIIPGLAPGRADGDKRITWHYRQEKGQVGEYAIQVEIISPDF